RTEAVLGEGLGAYDAHLEDARNRESFGLAARNEVLAVQVERDRAELDLLEVRRDVLVAEADLRRLLDLTDGTRVETAEPLEAPPPAAADPRAPRPAAPRGRPGA